jgi:hypothetical protein
MTPAHRAVPSSPLPSCALQACLDRVALSLGGNAMAASLGPVLTAWARDGDWKKRAAVLISLAQVAEGCQKVRQPRSKAWAALLLRAVHLPACRGQPGDTQGRRA